MFSIVGILVVFGAVLAGYLLEKGNIRVLMQPAELIIIGGAAVGTVLVANPPHILKKIAGVVASTLKGSKFNKQRYLDSLKMMFDLCSKARKEGIVALESDIEDPSKSPIFSKYPFFMADSHARDFVCDTIRMAVTGGVDPLDIDQMMELDMEVHHQGSRRPATALTSMADSLPGLGIVAAVLGVVITMGALGGPPEEIGKKVAAALVGTFLGVLLCYGLVGPLAANMENLATEEHAYYHVLRVVMLAFIKGTSPLLAIEIARRAIPSHVRPNFHEVEAACRSSNTLSAPAVSTATASAAV